MSSETVSDERLVALIHTQRGSARILRERGAAMSGWHPSWADHMETVADALEQAAIELQALRSKPVANGVEVKPWDELARDQARAKAAELIKAKGWKAGDSFSVTAMLALMVEFAEQAHTVTDRCGYPDCGCDFDARCMDALRPKATAPVVSEPVAWQYRIVVEGHEVEHWSDWLTVPYDPTAELSGSIFQVRLLYASPQIQPNVMTVIVPDQWEPCSPQYLERGGKCDAPRVWNAQDHNHWHPRLQPQP